MIVSKKYFSCIFLREIEVEIALRNFILIRKKPKKKHFLIFQKVLLQWVGLEDFLKPHSEVFNISDRTKYLWLFFSIMHGCKDEAWISRRKLMLLPFFELIYLLKMDRVTMWFKYIIQNMGPKNEEKIWLENSFFEFKTWFLHVIEFYTENIVPKTKLKIVS